LRGSVRRSPHQATADLQTCDTRSASALYSRNRFRRRYPVLRRGAGCARSLPLQGSDSNRRGPAYGAGLGASTRPAKEPV